MIKHTFIAALFAAAAMLPAGQAHAQTSPDTTTASGNAELFEDEVLAKGDGFEIKRSELDAITTSIKAGAAGQGRSVPPAQIQMIERNFLDRLIQLRLIMKVANEADKTQGKAEAANRIQQIRENAPSPEFIDAQLKSMGMTMADLQNRYEQDAIAEKHLERVLRPDDPFTEAQAKEYYDNHPENFESPEMVRAAHVLISTKDPATGEELSDERKAARLKLANDILKRARDGEDFAKLAKEYSDDPGSKDSGGEYTFPRGQMVPEFEQAAFSLKTNEVSDIVTTQFGYHIIKLYEKTAAEKNDFAGTGTKTILRGPNSTDVTINDILLDEAVREKVDDYLAGLKEKANVEILDENLKPVKAPQAASPPVAVPSE
jgi:parvulin-like peptidyl-prolyl isomerase